MSRVGGKAQLAAYRAVSGQIKLAYSQFEELENFSRFDSKLDPHTQQTIDRGKRIRACLGQPQLQPIPVLEQIHVLNALSLGVFDTIPLHFMHEAEICVRNSAPSINKDVADQILTGKDFSEAQQQELRTIAQKSISHLKEKK